MSASTWQPSRALNDSRPPYSTQPADCTATAKLILNPSTRVVPQKQVSAMLAPTGGILHQQTGGCHPHPTASPVSALQAYSDRQRQHAAYPPAAAQLQSQQIARQHYEWGFTALHAAGQTACMPAATQAAPSDLTHSARLPAHPLLQRLQTTVNSHNPSHIPGHVHCTPPNKWNPQQDAQHPLTMQYAVTPAAAGTETSSCSSGLPAARSSQGKRSNSKCKDAEVLKLVGQSLTKSGKASRRYRSVCKGSRSMAHCRTKGQLPTAATVVRHSTLQDGYDLCLAPSCAFCPAGSGSAAWWMPLRLSLLLSWSSFSSLVLRMRC